MPEDNDVSANTTFTVSGLPMPTDITLLFANNQRQTVEGFIVEPGEDRLDALVRLACQAGAYAVQLGARPSSGSQVVVPAGPGLNSRA